MSEEKRNTNIDESETPEDEFEVLMARFLWDDLDHAGQIRLDALAREFPDFARRRREYTETRGFFQRAPGGDLRGLDIIAAAPPIQDARGMELSDDELLNDLPPELAGFEKPITYIPVQPGPKLISLESRRPRSGPGKFLGGGLAAAAALLLGLGIFYFYGGASAPSETMTLSLGDCRSGQKVLKPGDAPENGVLVSGKDSVCDIQFREPASIAVRLEPESRLSFSRRAIAGGERSELILNLEGGRILLQAERISQTRGLLVRTPGHLVRVLGTRLTVDGNRPDRLRVQLADGRAEVVTANYLYLPAFRGGISPGVRAELEKKLPELFREERRELAPGTYVRVNRTAGFQANNRALFNQLNEILGKSAADGSTPEAGTVARARKLLNESAGKNTLLTKPGVDTGRDSRYHALKLKRRFETFGLLAADELKPDALAARKVDAKRILKLVRRASDEPTYIYRVHLKDGKIHMGLLEQVGDKYRLFTGERGIMIRKAQVEKIELVVDE